MEDIEKITTEVTETAQAYLDSREDETSSIAIRGSFMSTGVKKLKLET